MDHKRHYASAVSLRAFCLLLLKSKLLIMPPFVRTTNLLWETHPQKGYETGSTGFDPISVWYFSVL